MGAVPHNPWPANFGLRPKRRPQKSRFAAQARLFCGIFLYAQEKTLILLSTNLKSHLKLCQTIVAW